MEKFREFWIDDVPNRLHVSDAPFKNGDVIYEDDRLKDVCAENVVHVIEMTDSVKRAVENYEGVMIGLKKLFDCIECGAITLKNEDGHEPDIDWLKEPFLKAST